MRYGALPGTLTGKLSVPHQNPGGPSPAGASRAAAPARPVTLAAAVPPVVRASARQAATASQVLLMMPPVDPLTARPMTTRGPVTLKSQMTVPGAEVLFPVDRMSRYVNPSDRTSPVNAQTPPFVMTGLCR